MALDGRIEDAKTMLAMLLWERLRRAADGSRIDRSGMTDGR